MIEFFKSTGMRWYFAVLILVWLAYAGLTLLAPPAQSTYRYGLSPLQVNLVRVTILLPYLLIWTAGLFAVLRFKKYTELLGNAPESPGFRKITIGLATLLAVVVIPPFITLISSHNPDSGEIHKYVTIVRNYVTVSLYLTAFYFIWEASYLLNKALGAMDRRASGTYFMSILAIVALSSTYVWSVFQNNFRSVSNDPLVRPTYYLPDPAILLTIVVPYVLLWTLGCLAIYNLSSLRKNVQGIVYQKVFSSVNRGLLVLVSLVMGLQFLSQTSYFLSRASFSIILIIIYVLFFMIAAGYLYLARGAKSLSTIEEV